MDKYVEQLIRKAISVFPFPECQSVPSRFLLYWHASASPTMQILCLTSWLGAWGLGGERMGKKYVMTQ